MILPERMYGYYNIKILIPLTSQLNKPIKKIYLMMKTIPMNIFNYFILN